MTIKITAEIMGVAEIKVVAQSEDRHKRTIYRQVKDAIQSSRDVFLETFYYPDGCKKAIERVESGQSESVTVQFKVIVVEFVPNEACKDFLGVGLEGMEDFLNKVIDNMQQSIELSKRIKVLGYQEASFIGVNIIEKNDFSKLFDDFEDRFDKPVFQVSLSAEAQIRLDVYKQILREFEDYPNMSGASDFAEEYVERMLRYSLMASDQVDIKALSYSDSFEYDCSDFPGKVLIRVPVDFEAVINIECNPGERERFLKEKSGESEDDEISYSLLERAEKLLSYGEGVENISIASLGGIEVLDKGEKREYMV